MRRLRALALLHAHPREGGRRPPSRVTARTARAVAVAAATLGVVACSRGGGEADRPAPATPRSGPVTVSARGDVDASWVTEDRLHLAGGGSSKLAAAVNSTLIATLAPAAVPRGPAAVAYNSWRGTRPTVRIRDLRSGDESVLDEGAHSVAWAGDGRLAYFRALQPDLSDPRRYLGHVVVRASRRVPAQPWTARPGRYVVAAWARGRILFYRLGGGGFPDLLVLDRQRRQRLLAARSALVAVSPDGRRAFVSRYGSSPPVVRVLDVASGAEAASLQIDAERVEYVLESGSWVRDTVFASTTAGIAVFRAGRDSIELEQVLRAQATFPRGLSEPRASPDGRSVLAWGEIEPQPRQAVAEAQLVECDRSTLRCVRAALASAAAPPRPVYNPSRP